MQIKDSSLHGNSIYTQPRVNYSAYTRTWRVYHCTTSVRHECTLIYSDFIMYVVPSITVITTPCHFSMLAQRWYNVDNKSVFTIHRVQKVGGLFIGISLCRPTQIILCNMISSSLYINNCLFLLYDVTVLKNNISTVCFTVLQNYNHIQHLSLIVSWYSNLFYIMTSYYIQNSLLDQHMTSCIYPQKHVIQK